MASARDAHRRALTIGEGAESSWVKPDFGIDIGVLRRVELRVRDHDGGPAPATLLIGRADEELPFAWRTVLATDLRGHAVPTCRPGAS